MTCGVSGGCGLAATDEFELDWCELVEAFLLSSVMVGALGQFTIRVVNSARVRQGWQPRTVFWRSEKNDSIIALSRAEAAHRPDAAVVLESAGEGSGTEQGGFNQWPSGRGRSDDEDRAGMFLDEVLADRRREESFPEASIVRIDPMRSLSCSSAASMIELPS